MAGQYKWISATAEEIISSITNPDHQNIAAKIFEAFSTHGLSYKTRAEYVPKSQNQQIGYIVHFYIKKSKEAIIMNSYFFKLQLRINNQSTFERLDDYSYNIRKAILEDSTPCKACSKDGNFTGHGEYIFQYHGKEYRLCQMLCNNFKLYHLTKDDVDSLIDIINHEISYVGGHYVN